MGFLDHSTSNIIIDAVLTDLGRRFLARNDGSFSIVKFALADDEVDYTLIQKYGRAVGKEKIEKNTPIFEAQTSSANALKYRLISLSNPNVVYVPKLTLASQNLDATGNVITLSSNASVGSASVDITVTQEITGVSTIDVELRDNQFLIKMDNKFLQLARGAPDVVDPSGMAVYTRRRNQETTSAGGSILNFRLTLKTITDTQYSTYGDGSSIDTVVTVTGLQSGVTKSFTATITK
jgi:hypothetical protein